MKPSKSAADDRQPVNLPQDEDLMAIERIDVETEFDRSEALKEGRMKAETTELKASYFDLRVSETCSAASSK